MINALSGRGDKDFRIIPQLETARVILLPLELADAEAIQRIFPYWEVVRYLASSVPWPYPPDGAYTYVRDFALPAIERGEEWHWTLRLKSEPERLIGAIALMKDEHHNRGFWLGQAWQGQGLMTEAANAATDYWFDELGFPSMRIPKAVANTGSRRISEKQGMRLTGLEERDYVSGRLPGEIWEITAEEWRSARAKNLDVVG